MKKILIGALIAVCLISVLGFINYSQKAADKTDIDKLVIVWSSGDADVFTKLVYVYGLNSKRMKWWSEVELLIWGPSSKLLSENEELQKNVKEMADQGVVLTACKWCADQYEVSEKLTEIGVDVKYMGKPLTEYLKTGCKVITF